MEEGQDTRVDRILRSLKNRPVIAVAVVLAVIMISLASFTNALRTLWSVVPKPDKDLELVDAHLIDDPEQVKAFKASWLRNTPSDVLSLAGEKGEFPTSGTFPLLDIKLRNMGKSIAVLHALEIGVRRKALRKYPPIACDTLPPTWEYNTLLEGTAGTEPSLLDVYPPRGPNDGGGESPELQDGPNDGDNESPGLQLHEIGKAPETVTLSLSQVVEPNKAERFVVAIGQTEYAEATYELTIALRFNKDQLLKIGNFSLKIAGPPACQRAWKMKTVRRPNGAQ